MTVGQTKDAGYQIGVTRTFDCTAAEAWNTLTSGKGLATWLPGVKKISTTVGSPYKGRDFDGEVRSYHEGKKIRLVYQPNGRMNSTTLQVTVTDKGERALVRFHQERLSGTVERNEQRGHWLAVLDGIGALLPQSE